MANPIKLIHIAPTSLIHYVDEHYNKGLNMVLTHLVLSDLEYRQAFEKVGGEKYLDNSFFELGYCIEPVDMLKAAAMVNATVLICPDGTTEGLELFKSSGLRVMCIPKTPEQFVEFMGDENIDLVGVSEEHLAYRHCPGARYELFRDHITEDMPAKKIHLLGATDSCWELGMLSPYSKWIYSWDSSAAVWQGYNSSLLSLQTRKNTESVDFSADVEWNQYMENNIKFLEAITQ
jgi:hypothetical protein